jgi:hypothetical protein
MDAEFQVVQVESRFPSPEARPRSPRWSPAAWNNCHIRECTCGIREGWFAHGPEQICPEHFNLASPSTRRLFMSARNRLERIEAGRASEAVFEGIVARGRYLQFCGLIEAAHDHLDWAWERVKREVGASVADEERPFEGDSPALAPQTGGCGPRPNLSEIRL